MSRVLYVIAHPDDEDPYTVTHLCRALGCQVTLFTLTRGEGGDNARGGQTDEALGLLRTCELLEAADRYGVAEVLTASAVDYGYSRRFAEAEARWDAAALAAELDAAIDRVLPDVVATHFDQDQEDEHAHHRYAGWLTRRVIAARRARGAITPRLLVGVPGPVALAMDPAHRELAVEGYARHVTQGGEALLAMRPDLPRGFVDPDRPEAPRSLAAVVSPSTPIARPPSRPPATSSSWPLARDDDRAAMYRWRVADHRLVALLPPAVAAAHPIPGDQVTALPDGYPAYRGAAPPPPPRDVTAAPPGPIGLLTADREADPLERAIAHLSGQPPRRLDRLTEGALADLAVAVVGLRAYRDLPAGARGGLLDFCRAGGHAVVLAQHQGFDPAVDAPYRAVLPGSAEEVCEEDSPVVLLGDHPLLLKPYRLTAADFAGWHVQRGGRFWSSWDPSYSPLIELCDPGRAPQRGAWLTARVGRGHYTYCALALHLQLPRAVVGAYRLLANLLSLT